MEIEDLKKLRKDTGLTQKLFAEKVGVSMQLVAMTETGQRAVSLRYIQKLSTALNKKIKITFYPEN